MERASSSHRKHWRLIDLSLVTLELQRHIPYLSIQVMQHYRNYLVYDCRRVWRSTSTLGIKGDNICELECCRLVDWGRVRREVLTGAFKVKALEAWFKVSIELVKENKN